VYWVHVLHTCMCSITVCVRVCTLYTYICMYNTSYTQYTCDFWAFWLETSNNIIF
jgi:hypothetical protein